MGAGATGAAAPGKHSPFAEQVSPAAQGGLHADTHVPFEQTKPARHSGTQVCALAEPEPSSVASESARPKPPHLMLFHDVPMGSRLVERTGDGKAGTDDRSQVVRTEPGYR